MVCVYVAMSWMDYEGSTILGIYGSREAAIECCLAQKYYGPDGWIKDGIRDVWSCNGDNVGVYQHEVQAEYKPPE